MKRFSLIALLLFTIVSFAEAQSYRRYSPYDRDYSSYDRRSSDRRYSSDDRRYSSYNRRYSSDDRRYSSYDRLPRYDRYSYSRSRYKKEDYRGRSYLGVKASGNHSLLINKTLPVELGLAPEYDGGLVFNFSLGNVLSLQPEILYSRNSLVTYSRGGDLKTTTSSIDVPVLFRFSFGNKTQFFINAGGAARYALETKERYAGGMEQTTDYEGQDFDQRTTYGAAGGMGIALNSYGGQFFIEARGYYPMGSFRDGWLEGSENRRLNVGLSLGYLARFGR